MLESMTGFAAKEAKIPGIGRVCLELRSINHKFFDLTLHVPEGFLSLEENMRKEIAAKIKRGRIICAVNLAGGQAGKVFVNNSLLKSYFAQINRLRQQLRLKEPPTLDTLMHLPGVVMVSPGASAKRELWPALKSLLRQGLQELVRVRQREGRALAGYLRKRSLSLNRHLDFVEARFKKAIKTKIQQFKTDEERSAFLKDSDISEEISRLSFHLKNFKNKIQQTGPIGKELDFIAQEMQREANTIGAKSFDALISNHTIQIKSQVEKIREQAQNIE